MLLGVFLAVINPFELHPDRLGTSDAAGKRIFLHPADVTGFFRRWRTKVQLFLIVIFLILPWIKISGRQALLLNIADRQFEIFGLSLRAHNAPLLLLVLAAAAFGLFAATAVFGRVWCGWACPQTVFIDGVFRKIERYIEGSALERRKLDRAPWSFVKFLKRTSKWMIFTFIALVLTHSFLAYFVGTVKLATMVQSSPLENRGDFLFMFFTTGLILFDFGWFREQFCTIVCPYGRFQSVLMDKGSLVVAYDANRGEPRATPQAKALAKSHGGKLGDCVSCYRCVQVCPTGIDIRRGVQMECIACTACVDACDEVMTKVNKPLGLIRYTSEKRPKTRALAYLALCLTSIAVLFYLLASLHPIDIEVLRAKDTPYTVLTLADGTKGVVNHFILDLNNQSGSDRKLSFGIVSSETAPNSASTFQLVMVPQTISIPKDQAKRVDLFIRFPQKQLANGRRSIRLFIRDFQESETGESPFYQEKEIPLVGPYS